MTIYFLMVGVIIIAFGVLLLWFEPQLTDFFVGGFKNSNDESNEGKLGRLLRKYQKFNQYAAGMGAIIIGIAIVAVMISFLMNP